ncbi:MAG: dihydrodipicolinate synthase family protein, partial [Pseudomonadota bacterium]
VGLVPFGTTGEALSVGLSSRIKAFKSLIDGGIDPNIMIPGTGLPSLEDTAYLSSTMLDLGARAVMVLPPFFYKDIFEEGLFDYFSKLIILIGKKAKIIIYHIPQISNIEFSPKLVRYLHQHFPEQIIGIKDSSGDWQNTASLLAIDNFYVYPGSELLLKNALPAGIPGCISACANINSKQIAEIIDYYDAGQYDDFEKSYRYAVAFRAIIQRFPMIQILKQIQAHKTNDHRWATVCPPLLPASNKKYESIRTLLTPEFEHLL